MVPPPLNFGDDNGYRTKSTRKAPVRSRVFLLESDSEEEFSPAKKTLNQDVRSTPVSRSPAQRPSESRGSTQATLHTPIPEKKSVHWERLSSFRSFLSKKRENPSTASGHLGQSPVGSHDGPPDLEKKAKKREGGQLNDFDKIMATPRAPPENGNLQKNTSRQSFSTKSLGSNRLLSLCQPAETEQMTHTGSNQRGIEMPPHMATRKPATQGQALSTTTSQLGSRDVSNLAAKAEISMRNPHKHKRIQGPEREANSAPTYYDQRDFLEQQRSLASKAKREGPKPEHVPQTARKRGISMSISTASTQKAPEPKRQRTYGSIKDATAFPITSMNRSATVSASNHGKLSDLSRSVTEPNIQGSLRPSPAIADKTSYLGAHLNGYRPTPDERPVAPSSSTVDNHRGTQWNHNQTPNPTNVSTAGSQRPQPKARDPIPRLPAAIKPQVNAKDDDGYSSTSESSDSDTASDTSTVSDSRALPPNQLYAGHIDVARGSLGNPSISAENIQRDLNSTAPVAGTVVTDVQLESQKTIEESSVSSRSPTRTDAALPTIDTAASAIHAEPKAILANAKTPTPQESPRQKTALATAPSLVQDPLAEPNSPVTHEQLSRAHQVNPPSLSPNAVPYFEYTIHQKIWQTPSSANSQFLVTPPNATADTDAPSQSLLLTPTPSLPIANAQSDLLFTTLAHANASFYHGEFTAVSTSRAPDTACAVHTATFTPAARYGTQTHVQIWVQRFANVTEESLRAGTSFLATTLFALRFDELVDGSVGRAGDGDSDTASDDDEDEDRETLKSLPTSNSTPTPVRRAIASRTGAPWPETFTTLALANGAARDLQLEHAHKAAPTSPLDRVWQATNARELLARLDLLNERGECWESCFDGCEGKRYRVGVERVGVRGPRNV